MRCNYGVGLSLTVAAAAAAVEAALWSPASKASGGELVATLTIYDGGEKGEYSLLKLIAVRFDAAIVAVAHGGVGIGSAPGQHQGDDLDDAMPHEGVVSRPSILILLISFSLAVDLFEGVVVEEKVGSGWRPPHRRRAQGAATAQNTQRR
jgi:hypothetical protein